MITLLACMSPAQARKKGGAKGGKKGGQESIISPLYFSAAVLGIISFAFFSYARHCM
jgi:hypothetical protein